MIKPSWLELVLNLTAIVIFIVGEIILFHYAQTVIPFLIGSVIWIVSILLLRGLIDWLIDWLIYRANND